MPEGQADERRDAIVALLAEHPGMSSRGIANHFGWVPAMSKNYLATLVHARRIWYEKTDSQICYFVGKRPLESEVEALVVMAKMDELDHQIVKEVDRRSNPCQKDLIEVFDGMASSTVQHRIKRLVRLGVLFEDWRPRSSRYSVTSVLPRILAGRGSA